MVYLIKIQMFDTDGEPTGIIEEEIFAPDIKSARRKAEKALLSFSQVLNVIPKRS